MDRRVAALLAMTDLAAGELLAPRSIVVVGASERSRWSQGAVDNLRGFAGPVHLVNPRGGVVHGQVAATSCAGLGERVPLRQAFSGTLVQDACGRLPFCRNLSEAPTAFPLALKAFPLALTPSKDRATA